jgi:hypothetical protein
VEVEEEDQSGENAAVSAGRGLHERPGETSMSYMDEVGEPGKSEVNGSLLGYTEWDTSAVAVEALHQHNALVEEQVQDPEDHGDEVAVLLLKSHSSAEGLRDRQEVVRSRWIEVADHTQDTIQLQGPSVETELPAGQDGHAARMEAQEDREAQEQEAQEAHIPQAGKLEAWGSAEPSMERHAAPAMLGWLVF